MDAPGVEAVNARGNKPVGGAGEVTVSAVDPDTVTTDTILSIHVFGSGFTTASQLSWELAGLPTTVVATRAPVVLISSRELVAEVAISRDASLARYDAVVTAAGGKKGTGVEMLQVVAKPIILPIPDWGRTPAATDVNDGGVIVGSCLDAYGVQHPLRWTPGPRGWEWEELETAGTAAGVNTSAWGINNEGYIILHANPDPYSHWASVLLPSGEGEVSFGDLDLKAINNLGTVIAPGAIWRRIDASSWGEPVEPTVPPGYLGGGVFVINDQNTLAGTLWSFGSGGQTLSWASIWEADGDQWGDPIYVDHEYPGAPRAINHHGALAGQIWPCPDRDCPARAAYWPPYGGAAQVLPAEYTSGRRRGSAIAYDMNDADLIVGEAPFWMGKGPSIGHAVVWRPGLNSPVDLGASRMHEGSYAWAINNSWPAIAVGRFGASAAAWIVF